MAVNLIVAGSRDFEDYDLLCKVMKEQNVLQFEELTIISGGARGADSLGERWAKNNDVKLLVMHADWDKFGKSAGYRRNVAMANKATHLLAFWDGESKGTNHMINIASARNLEICVFNYETGEYL